MDCERRHARQEREAQIRHLLGVARSCAIGQGVAPDDVEDCALEFVERWLQRNAGAPPLSPPDARPRRYAINWAKNYYRRQILRLRREMAWPEQSDEGRLITMELADTGPKPDTDLLRSEFHGRIANAVKRLLPGYRELFVRHYYRNEPLADLAAATGRNPEALRKALKRACLQVRAGLARNGFEEPQANTYLILLATPESLFRLFQPTKE